MNSKIRIICYLLLLCFASSQIMDNNKLKQYIFTEKITGDLTPLEPTGYGISKLWPFPV